MSVTLVKRQGKILLVCGFATVTTSCLAQTPPANDDFVNRIPLIGSTVTFSGSTAGATEPWFSPPYFEYPDTVRCLDYSIWWSWTAPTSSIVIVEKLGPYTEVNGVLIIFSTNVTEIFQPAVCFFDLQAQGQYVAFNADAGKEYQIRASASETNELTFRLTMTNDPVFRLQPRTQTVSSNGSALFTSWAAGIQPLHYQWRFSGVDIPNATNAMLPILSANSTNTGEYCVVVSSVAGGVSTSAVARLIISTNDPLPSVKALHSVGQTNFEFMVNGEEGRRYLVESSTNLIDWPTPQLRSGLNNTNQTTFFQILRDAPKKFFRLSPYHPQNEICDLNMRQLRMAAWYFAEDAHQRGHDSVNEDNLLPYLGPTHPYCTFASLKAECAGL